MYNYKSPVVLSRKQDPPQSPVGTFMPEFMEKYYPFLDGRKDTFRYMVEYLDKIDNPVIVETGTVRWYNDWGAGQSTVIWDNILKNRGGKVWSIDLDEKHVNISREQTSRVDYILGDSVQSLDMISSTVPDIDLLYLDSMDIDWDNPHPSSMHHIKELICIWSRVKPGGLIAVDDNMYNRGKGAYVGDFLNNLGCPCIFNNYQIGFIKNPSY